MAGTMTAGGGGMMGGSMVGGGHGMAGAAIGTGLFGLAVVGSIIATLVWALRSPGCRAA